MNPAVWVERHGRRRPADPALAEGERVHASWSEFADRTARAAAGLRDDFGLSPGDRAAIVMRNRPEYLEALFAIWHAGLVAVPVNARLHRDEYFTGRTEQCKQLFVTCSVFGKRRALRLNRYQPRAAEHQPPPRGRVHPLPLSEQGVIHDVYVRC